MTDEQREQIRRLRYQGIGYGSIAELLSLPENTVKSFCKRNGLAGKLAKGKTEIPDGHYCKCCGLPVLQNEKRKEKKFCSTECRMQYWRTHQDLVQHKAIYNYECAYCHKPFVAIGNPHRKYCSHACYISGRFGGKDDDGGTATE